MFCVHVSDDIDIWCAAINDINAKMCLPPIQHFALTSHIVVSFGVMPFRVHAKWTFSCMKNNNNHQRIQKKATERFVWQQNFKCQEQWFDCAPTHTYTHWCHMKKARIRTLSLRFFFELSCVCYRWMTTSVSLTTQPPSDAVTRQWTRYSLVHCESKKRRKKKRQNWRRYRCRHTVDAWHRRRCSLLLSSFCTEKMLTTIDIECICSVSGCVDFIATVVISTVLSASFFAYFSLGVVGDTHTHTASVIQPNKWQLFHIHFVRWKKMMSKTKKWIWISNIMTS